MTRLVFALALFPVLLVTGVHAQAVSPDIAKTLWCAEAFSVLFGMQKAQIDPATKDIYDAFVVADGKLLETGTQGYLDAGYTEEQVTKLKADLVTEVTPIVSSQGQTGKYSPDECNPVLHKYLVMPATSSSAAAPQTSSSPAASDASSSAQ